METKLCGRCVKEHPLSAFGKFKSGKPRATCENCLRRDNTFRKGLKSTPRKSIAQQVCTPRKNPPISPPRSVTESTNSTPLVAPHVMATPSPSCTQQLPPPELIFPSLNPNGQTAPATCIQPHIMPSTEALVALEPKIGPLLASLREHGSFVLLYIPRSSESK